MNRAAAKAACGSTNSDAFSVPPTAPGPRHARPHAPCTDHTALPHCRSSVPASPDGRQPPGRSSTGHGGGGGGRLATTPTGGQPHDRSGRGSRATPGGGGGGGAGGANPLTGSPTYAASMPVAAPEGVLFLIAHDAPHGGVRFLGDLPGGGGGGGGALAAVWRAVAACRLRFGAHNVAIAAPPKHARCVLDVWLC